MVTQQNPSDELTLLLETAEDCTEERMDETTLDVCADETLVNEENTLENTEERELEREENCEEEERELSDDEKDENTDVEDLEEKTDVEDAEDTLESDELITEEEGSKQHVVLSPQIFPSPVFVPPLATHSALVIHMYPGGQEILLDADTAEDTAEEFTELLDVTDEAADDTVVALDWFPPELPCEPPPVAPESPPGWEAVLLVGGGAELCPPPPVSPPVSS